MISDDLKKRARLFGILPNYRTEDGDAVDLSNDALTALVDVLSPFGSVALDDDAADGDEPRCPGLPRGSKLWGATCQLYGLRSSRSLGIGDFSDLARFGQEMGRMGADFIGINPLHALLPADPSRTSPYSPSTRRFINPLYIALDWLPGGKEAVDALRREQPEDVRSLDGPLVDYHLTSALKFRLLRLLFSRGAERGPALEAYCARQGRDLEAYAAFEILSARHSAAGLGAGWRDWPEEHQRASDALVSDIAAQDRDEFDFFKWIQFIADQQIARVQASWRAADMRVGLYLDFAIGVAPDGFDTWADPDLTTPRARIGAPPDAYNAKGQDWGLAPIVPSMMAARKFEPYRDTMSVVMRHAGAIRLDHAMALERLWWIPETMTAAEGGYVRYPFRAMATALAKAARETGTLVIGEDLGTVPKGFRARIGRANIFSYRVLYFERDEDGAYNPPDTYPPKSLASVSTHDLPTLMGWWRGSDIDLRKALGLIDAGTARRGRKEREAEKRSLLALLTSEGWFDSSERRDQPVEPAPLAAVHGLLARSRSALMAVQLEDLLGLEDQANVPGTVTEHPNWQRRYPVMVEDLAKNPTLIAVAEAIAKERPARRPGRTRK